jgi:hypothetical protein
VGRDNEFDMKLIVDEINQYSFVGQELPTTIVSVLFF